MFKQGNRAPGETLSVFTEVTGELRVCVNRAKQSAFIWICFCPRAMTTGGSAALVKSGASVQQIFT